MEITKAYREGCDDATSEIRCGTWTRERAVAYLAATRSTRPGELGDYSRGFDATIQAYASNAIDLGVVAVAQIGGAS